MKDEGNIFEVGDIVILKSDKYKDFPTVMTVEEVEMGRVSCVWSARDGNFCERSFSTNALQLYNEDEL